MGDKQICQCGDTTDLSWHPSPCDEAGWTCQRCGFKAPGEPAGYRPDLDRDLIEIKVENILMDLTIHDLHYVSSSSEGDYLARSVAVACSARGLCDQGSIIKEILSQDSDGKFWKERGDAIRAGKDTRERCACGKLATSFTIVGNGQPSIGRCSEHGAAHLIATLTAEPRDSSEPEPWPEDPWEAYGMWEEKWREDHPDDERDSLGLIDEYARVPADELKAFFEGMRAEREGGGQS